MANVKITELTAATALASTDVLPIVDVGADATKKVSVSDLLRNLPDGTASAPALAFADDQNTGVLSPAANELAFATSGTQRLVIDSSGNVGIGDSSPSSLGTNITTLEIKGAAATRSGGIRLSTSNDSQKGAFYVYDGAGVVGTETAHPFGFITGNTERARIDSSGNLGIGTSSPSELLEVSTSVNETPAGLSLYSRDTSIAGTQEIGAIYGKGLDSGDSGPYVGGKITFAADGTWDTDTNYYYPTAIKFYTQEATGTDNVAAGPRMVINSSGKVGIGTSSPAHGPLHVHSSTTTAYFHLTNSTTGSAASDGFSLFVTGNDTVLNQRESANMRFFTANTEAMRIDSSGKVQIGRTSPLLSTELTVGGNNGLTVGKTNGSRIGMFGSFNQDLLIIGTYDDFPVVFRQNNTERMRIDSSGDVEIMQGKNLTWVYQGGSTHRARIRAESSDALIFENGSGNSERMRIDSSGNLLVGTTTANGNMTVNMGTDKNISFNGNQGEVGNVPAFVATNNAGSSLASMGFRATDLRFATGSAERMRITSGGNVLFNCTSLPSASVQGFLITGTSSGNTSSSGSSTSAYNHLLFYNGNGIVGSISTSGSTTTYSTSSDYRLKENVIALDGAITRIKQLQPRRFNFIADPGTTVDGFVAHEAQTVVPEAITGTHNEVDDDGNAVMQGIDQSKLVPLLTAALQEAIAKIETLETKVAALEAQ